MSNDDKYKDGYNESQLSFGGRHRAFTDVNELKELIIEYFQTWAENKRPVTVAGLAVFLGIGKSTLHDYEKGTYDSEEHKFSDTIKMAKDYIENDKWEKALLGFYNAPVAIFDLKNNHDCKDKIENNNIGTTKIMVIDSDDSKL